MDISGNSTNNTHNGDTRILGNLEVDGNILVDNALGQSEYLDSGEYKSVISNISGITNVSFDSFTRTYYEKQGNLVKLYTTLKITFTSVLASSFQFRITVPALDIFEKKINGAYCNASGSFVNQYDCDSFASVIDDANGIINVIYQRFPISNVNLPFGGDAYSSLTIVYKLEGDDVPATVLLAGGSGSGDVKNPMLENLDGGGFSIINIDSIVANSITAPNVVTNPLSTNLNANNKSITNINSVDAETLNASNTNTSILSTDTINSLIAPNITFSNNINMNDKIIKGCNELNSQNGDLIIKGLTSGGTFPASKISLEAFKIDLSQCPNGLDMGTNPIDNAGIITANELSVNNINGVNGNDLNITNVDDPVVITGSKIEMRSNPPGIGKVEYYTDIDMKDNNIDNVGIISKTGAMEFKATTGYIFDNYVDFLTKRFNGIKYVKAEPDFEDVNNLFGVYVIVGNIVMTQPLNISGSCLIAGYNNLSTLTFNTTTGIENTYCLRNTNNSGNIELKDFIFTNQSTSTRAGSLFSNNGVNTNVLRISNVNYYNCKNNFMLRIIGFELAELINNTFRYNYGGTSGPMCGIDAAKNTIIESCEFYNNYQLGNPSLIYSSVLLSISGAGNNLSITGNQFATYGVGSSGGINISNFATTNRVIIDGNVFDAEGGSDPSYLLKVDTSIHKGLICNENTGIVSCKASLEGLVNGNTVYTATQVGVWVPVDLTGFVTGNISRFIPGLSPYSFIYDATNPIKSLITVNCSADHDTKGSDTVQLGISVNGTVSVFIQGDLDANSTLGINLTTVLNLNFGDTIQLVCQNLTAGTNASGFRAVSLNASLIEI